MALSIVNITNIEDIAAEVATFATAEGWTVGGTAPAITLQRPEGGLVMEFTSSSTRVTIGSAAATTRIAEMNNIVLEGGGGGMNTVPLPTRLFLFSGTEQGSSFIAGVVEFGFNRYRMFYVGGTVIKGNYTGGEVVSANYFRQTTTGNQYPLDTRDHKFMFRGSEQASTLIDNSGWVNVVHADSPVPIKPFFSADISSAVSAIENFDEGSAYGGHADRVNGTLVDRGQVHFDAVTLLTPVNIYEGFGSPRRARPLGHIAGVRLVNMTNLQPGQTALIGMENWRVFPEFRFNPTTFQSVQGQFSDSFAADESSGYFGLAFAEDFAT